MEARKIDAENEVAYIADKPAMQVDTAVWEKAKKRWDGVVETKYVGGPTRTKRRRDFLLPCTVHREVRGIENRSVVKDRHSKAKKG